MSTQPAHSPRRLTGDQPSPIVVKVNTAREFLAAMPFILGFTPTESLVFAGMQANRVGPTARMDLVMAQTDPGHCARVIGRMFDTQGTWATTLIAYSDDEPVDGLEEIEMLLGLRGIEVVATMQVSSTHYWEHDRPGERRPVSDLDGTQARAELVAAGHAPARVRDDLAAGLTPYPASVRRQIARAAHWNEADLVNGHSPEETASTLRLLSSVFAEDGAPALRAPRSQDPPRPLTDMDSARLLAAVNNGKLRDVVTMALLMDLPIHRAWDVCAVNDSGELSRIMLEPGYAPRPNEERLDIGRELLRHLVRCGTGPIIARPMALLGQLYWWSGQGAQANVATELALAADPSVTMAGVMNSLLYSGVAPPWVGRLGADHCGSDHVPGDDALAGRDSVAFPAEESIGFGEDRPGQPGQ